MSPMFSMYEKVLGDMKNAQELSIISRIEHG
jgi:hypothetical protein